MLFTQTIEELSFELPDYASIIRQNRIPAFKEDGRYAGIASIPRRARNLQIVLEALYHQIDHFFVYLNDYETVPDWLNDEKFTVFRSQDYYDINATGKVFFAQIIDKGYFFTLDDDFVYPGNYAETFVTKLKRYENNVAGCVHGSIFPPNPDYYYMRSAIYQYEGGLLRDRFVCLPGTGSFCVKAGKIDMSLKQFLPQVMVDLAIAIICKKSGVPLISIARAAKWLQNTDRDGLYQQFTKQKTHHTQYAKEQGPWRFSEYAESIQRVEESVQSAGKTVYDDPQADIDAFIAARKGIEPYNWTNTPVHYRRLAEFYRSEQQAFSV